MRNLSLRRTIKLSRRGIMVIAISANSRGLSGTVEDNRITSFDGHGRGTLALVEYAAGGMLDFKDSILLAPLARTLRGFGGFYLPSVPGALPGRTAPRYKSGAVLAA